MELEDNSRAAIEFARTVIGIAEKLASTGIVVLSLDANWSSFGSWTLTLMGAEAARSRHVALAARDYQAGPYEVVRAVWDGKERSIRIEKLGWGANWASGQFVLELERRFDNRADGEDFAQEHLGKRVT
jgi:hypothetical protein